MRMLPRRRLIPKWRPVADTLKTAEASASATKTGSQPSESAAELEIAIEQWRAHKSPGQLGEVLSFSIDPKLREQVLSVGYEALKNAAEVTQVQTHLIHDLGKTQEREKSFTAMPLGPVEAAFPFQEPIQRLRALLRYSPDNALALLDFAQLQTALGKSKSAERALRTALSIAPNNRTVLRTLARFYVHTQRPDQAHQLIKRHGRTAQDPWLMASEIALADAAGSESAFLGKAKRFLIDHAKFPVAHLTELSGNIAISELIAGNLKKARESQRRALLAPNDNVVAQAIDFQHLFGIELISAPIKQAIKSSAEALLLKAWDEVDLPGIEQHAIEWHSQEPFSSRPIQLLSSLYAFKGSHQAALKWIEAGLRTDVSDRGLLINLAFVHASAGQQDLAILTLRRLRQLYGKDIEPYANATEGLIAYRSERFGDGDNLYDQAVAEFDKRNEHPLGAFCRLNQAFLAAELSHPEKEKLVGNAIEAFAAHPGLDSRMLLKIKFPDISPVVPAQKTELRKLSQWAFNPGTNTLIQTPGVTSTSAKALIIINRDT